LKFLFGLLPTLYFAQDKGTFFVPWTSRIVALYRTKFRLFCICTWVWVWIYTSFLES
jgi:hypothetical protein